MRSNAITVGWLAVLTEEEVGGGRIVLHHRADHLLREQRVLVPSVPVQMDGPWVILICLRGCGGGCGGGCLRAESPVIALWSDGAARGAQVVGLAARVIVTVGRALRARRVEVRLPAQRQPSV